MRVGPLMESVPNLSPSEASVQSADAKKRQLISFVDRLERRLAHLTRSTTADYNSTDGSTHVMRNSSPPLSNLDESSERLRRTLIRRQERPSWGPTENDSLSTSLLLIVLDDVWDVEVGQVLSSMPAAFMVTSRDQSVLSRVAGKVDQVSFISFYQCTCVRAGMLVVSVILCNCLSDLVYCVDVCSPPVPSGHSFSFLFVMSSESCT